MVTSAATLAVNGPSVGVEPAREVRVRAERQCRDGQGYRTERTKPRAQAIGAAPRGGDIEQRQHDQERAAAHPGALHGLQRHHLRWRDHRAHGEHGVSVHQDPTHRIAPDVGRREHVAGDSRPARGDRVERIRQIVGRVFGVQQRRGNRGDVPLLLRGIQGQIERRDHDAVRTRQ